MTSLNGELWTYEKLKVIGLSLSGIRTSFFLPDYSLAFDVAQGFPFCFTAKKFFISHAHMDHAAGIPYLISQKALSHQLPPQFYIPPSLIDPLMDMMKLWEKIEGHSYQYEFLPLAPSLPISVSAQTLVKAFPADHRVESFGFTLFEIKKKLSSEFKNLPSDQLAKLSREGINLNEFTEIPIFTYSGDTRIEFLKQNKWAQKSRVLFMECTYLDEQKSVQHAREWGHTHLDELIPLLDEIECEKIVLIHLSSRYSLEYAEKIIWQKVPQKHLHRIEVFKGR